MLRKVVRLKGDIQCKKKKYLTRTWYLYTVLALLRSVSFLGRNEAEMLDLRFSQQ
jgi:hypothetical protein